jgi:hypothetical protein
MKALSVKNPWAMLIGAGIKPIENRTWKTDFRGRVLIHTSQKQVWTIGDGCIWIFTKEMWLDIPKEFREKMRQDLIDKKWPNGCIIGEVDIVDCVLNHPSVWAEHTATKIKTIKGEKVQVEVPVYNWVLANPVFYDKPIENVKGALSLWEYKPQ